MYTAVTIPHMHAFYLHLLVTHYEMCSVIYFLNVGVKVDEISEVYGENSMSNGMVIK